MEKLHNYVIPSLLLLAISCSPSQRKANYRIALVPDRAGQNGIFVMRSDTTGGKLLMPDVNAQLRPYSWSPDGEKIAYFTILPEDRKMLTKYRMPSHFPLYEMDSSGHGRKRLLDFPVSDFRWSPDSRQLLLVSAYEDPGRNGPEVLRGQVAPMSAIYVFNLQNGEQRRLSSFGQHCSGDWSPDGTSLALSFGNKLNSDIYVADINGKKTRRITNSETIDINPRWSPDGKAIAYVSVPPPGSGGGSAGIYVINADGSNKRKMSGFTGYGVSWSPDGESLLIHSGGGLTLESLDGKTSTDLTPGTGRLLDAVFTPDGRKVMFRMNYDGIWHLYTVDPDGKNLKRLTGRLNASTFCLSPLLS